MIIMMADGGVNFKRRAFFVTFEGAEVFIRKVLDGRPWDVGDYKHGVVVRYD